MKNEQLLKKLKYLYARLKEMKTPSYSETDELEDFVESIMELDPYYAGLALTVSEGGSISKKQLCDIKKLKQKLEIIDLGTTEDKKTAEECSIYLETLEEIDDVLRKLAS